MRGYFEGSESSRKDDSGLYPIAYTAVNGGYRKVAKLGDDAPASVTLDGEDYARNDKGLHIGPEIEA